MRTLKTVSTASAGLALLAVAVIALNIIAGRLFVRADVTHDKVFSLSDGTKRILGKLDRDVTARLYFSRSMKELPVVVKTYATRVEEVLNEYKAHSGGKLTVEVVDPRPDTDDEEWAQKYGLSGVRLPKGDQMYFGVVFLSGSKEAVIPYLDPRREEFLEYDLSEGLVGTARKETAKIGVLSSLPVGGMPQGMPAGGEDHEWVFLTDLKKNFDVKMLAPDTGEIDQALKMVVIVHPKQLADKTLYAIDQYVLGGGRLIVAVDPMSRVDLQLAGMQARAQGKMPEASSDLGKLFEAWNIEFDKTQIVGDQGRATEINAGGQVVAYPYFMSLREEAFSHTSVITGNLHEMLFAEGGAVSLKKDSPYTFEPLIKTTKDAGVANATLAAFMMPQDLAKEIKTDGNERVLAALVRGKFKTAFPGGRPAAGAEDKDKAPPPMPHKAEADAETQIVVIADVDFLADQNAVDKFNFGNQVMMRVRNDNLSFLANAADYLAGSEDLIAIRSRGHIARPFSRVADLQKNAQQRWKDEEEKLTAQLTDLQKKLNELQNQRTDGNRFVLSGAQQTEISQFRAEEQRVRSRRREVRKSLREDIEALGRRLIALNLLVVPFATSLAGVGVFMSRGKRKRREAATKTPDGGGTQ